MNASENQVRIEVLQPEITSQIKQATLEELKNWITNGELKPNHQVRIKNLSWIEARNIPALRTLFEAKNSNPKSPPNQSNQQSLPAAPTPQQPSPPKIFVNSPPLPQIFVPEQIKPKIAEARGVPQSPTLSTADISFKNAPAENEVRVRNLASPVNPSFKTKPEIPVAPQPETVEPSAVFKMSKEKKEAESERVELKTDAPAAVSESEEPIKPKQAETKTKPVQTVSVSPKKGSLVRNTLIFAVGCVLMSALALGGSYVWVYQLRTPVEVDEKSLTELLSLEDKLTSDKLELRLKAAANEQRLKAAGKQENPAPPLDVSQEIAKLDNEYNARRKTVIENHQNKLADDDFNATFLFSLAVSLILFSVARIFYGKNAHAVENQNLSKSPQLQKLNSADVSAAAVQKVDLGNSRKSADARAIKSTESNQAESLSKTESPNDDSRASENAVAAQSTKLAACLLHRDEPSKFVCEICANYFCGECPKTFDDVENCCPFCKVVCKSAEEKINTATAAPQNAEPKKKPNLLDIGKDSDFIIYDFPESKTRKLGIIPAFVIALLFSVAISIFWVYKISPYLENRGKEVAQNAPSNETPKPGDANATKTLGLAANNNANSANGLSNGNAEPEKLEDCIDPKTKLPFECDDEMKRALNDHTKKVKSVEKAQKDVEEKTDLILSLFMPSKREKLDAAQQALKTPEQIAAELARAEKDKQLFIKVFASSFLIIFGLLLSTRFLGKDKTS